jgi:hypothetical protein
VPEQQPDATKKGYRVEMTKKTMTSSKHPLGLHDQLAIAGRVLVRGRGR